MKAGERAMLMALPKHLLKVILILLGCIQDQIETVVVMTYGVPLTMSALFTILCSS